MLKIYLIYDESQNDPLFTYNLCSNRTVIVQFVGMTCTPRALFVIFGSQKWKRSVALHNIVTNLGSNTGPDFIELLKDRGHLVIVNH